MNRRQILRSLALTAVAFSARVRCAESDPTPDDLRRIASQPVIDPAVLRSPVIIEQMELLRHEDSWLVRTRTKDGIAAITVPHQDKMALAAPLWHASVPRFIRGKDARNIEPLLWDFYRANYKLQGLLLGIVTAALEMAMLETLSLAATKPLAFWFGGARRRDIPIYAASSNRGNKPEDELRHLQKLARDCGAKALKFRLGARMSRNTDSPPGRSETLIRLARETFGPDFTLYADANSSYSDPSEAIRVGRLLEQHRYGFYEEPCEFDDFASTKRVADELDIPVAFGEQEFSMHRWEWCVAHRVADIMQPDLHYGGGYIPATRVARMAAAAGMSVVPHMSGGGLGYLDVIHFASFTPNIGPFMEFKGNATIPVSCPDSTLRAKDGVVRCPGGTGFGVAIDPEFIKRHQPSIP
jgi:L-alanine-DL-glutamate epimerase-like enolase superfamily enzyme